MKLFFILCLLVTWSSLSTAQGVSVCSDETIMAMKGNWKRLADVSHTPGNAAKANRIDAMSKLFQQAYPDPMGIEAFWYRSYTTRLFTNGGPDAYSFNSLYKSWYCNKNINKMVLGHETGTWAYVFVNYFSWFMSNQYDKLDFTIGGRNVYRLPKTKGEWKGYPLYQVSSHHLGTFNCVLIIRPGNELPWRPITQKNYLDERRKILAARQEESKDYPRKADSTYNKSIESIRKNTFMKEEDKTKIIENLRKSHEQQVATRNVSITKQIEYWQQKIDLIDNYIANTDPAVLQQPAITKNTAEFTGTFETAAQGGIELVTANPDYFKKNLAPEVPQMMILYWRWEKGVAAQDFKRRIEANFPIEKLQAMIDK